VDEALRLRRLWKVIAGVALGLSFSLLLLALVLVISGVVAGGYGSAWSLALAIPIALVATPLLLLGRAVWRRATRKFEG
jgi:predicted membrane protein